MSLARGRFGIEYDPRRLEKKSSGFGWIFVLIVLAVLVLLSWTLVRRIRAHVDEPEAVETPADPVIAEPPVPEPPPPPPINPGPKRPPKVRILLMRLETAEKNHDVEMAVSTIEQLRAMPGSPAADLDDSLARRLGALNLRRLFELRNAQWVKEVTIGRGDTSSRLAAENGSTLAALVRLNGGKEKTEKIVVGKKMYVMNHPRFNLVLHRRTRTADLSLNGKFFRRYDLKSELKAQEGSYEMPEKRRLFWTGIGSCFGPDDHAELDMLLPKGTPILVSEL